MLTLTGRGEISFAPYHNQKKWKEDYIYEITKTTCCLFTGGCPCSFSHTYGSSGICGGARFHCCQSRNPTADCQRKGLCTCQWTRRYMEIRRTKFIWQKSLVCRLFFLERCHNPAYMECHRRLGWRRQLCPHLLLVPSWIYSKRHKQKTYLHWISWFKYQNRPVHKRKKSRWTP